MGQAISGIQVDRACWRIQQPGIGVELTDGRRNALIG
jgi:hypothetical protein